MDTERWQRISVLFEESLQLPPDERRGHVESRCEDDTGLAREVLELLGADERGRIEPPGRTELRRAATRGDGEDLSGAHLGGYRLDRLLGRGGMGAVYLAHRTGDFEQEVAVKLIRRGMDTDDILERFGNERRVLARLTHPGIARLIDGGATEDGRPYLVMEVVVGDPIDRYCGERRLELAERLRLFLKVCDAIRHAHEHRVVHRDLKPSNILVTPAGEPKLLDFGIAKVLDATGSMRTVDVTATELRLMTPEYASPEQVRGGKVDARTDVYALGVILYELLTGAHPYRVSTGLRSDLERAILEEEPPRPSRRVDTRRLRAELAGDLDTIVLTAVRKEPGRRYASVSELAGDVERHLAGLPVLARPDTWHYRAAKFVRRNRMLVTAASAVLIALVLGLFGTLAMFFESEAERRLGLEREYAAQLAAAAGAISNRDAAAAQRYLAAAPVELRGWEWRHFSARADRSVLRLRGHAGRVRSLAVSADGTWVVSGGTGPHVLVHDLRTGEELRRFAVEDPDVQSLALVPGEERVLVQTERDRVWLHELATGALVRDYGAGDDSQITAVSGVRDGVFATGSQYGGVRVFDLETGERRAIFFPGDSRIVDIRFWRGSDRAVCGFEGGVVRVVDLERGETVRRIDVPELPGVERGSVFQGSAELNIDPDGRRVAVISEQGLAFVFDLETGEELARIPAQTVAGIGVTWSPDGRRLATSGRDCVVRVFDAASGERRATLLGHLQPVHRTRFLPGGERLVSTSTDGTLRVWDTRADDLLRVPEVTAMPLALDLFPDGRIATIGADTEADELPFVARVTSPDGRDTLATWRDEGRRPARAAVSANRSGDLLAVATGEGFALLDGATLEPRVRVPTEDPVHDLVFLSPDRLLVVDAARLAVFDAGGRVVQSAAHSVGEVFTLALDPSRTRFAAGCDGRAVVFDVAPLAPVFELAHEGELRGVDWSRAGDRIATASEHKTVRLWDVDSRECLFVLTDQSPIWDVAFTPDGRRLAVGPHDRTVRIWDTGRGVEVCTLRGHGSGVRTLAFSDDGSTLVSKARYGEVVVWDSVDD